jgi:hypothetical protein
MHFEWGPLLNRSLIHAIGQVFKWILKALMGCPCVGQNERNEDRSGKFIKIYL